MWQQMSAMNTKNIRNLSIYPDQSIANDGQDFKETQWKQEATKTVGVTTMSLVSEVKQKYYTTLCTIENLKNYVTSTEGKIKLGVMFLGFSSGCILAYRSKSRSLLYKRLIPATTLTLAASACYPYTAWNVSKHLYRGSVAVANTSARGVSYAYHTLGSMYTEKEENKPVRNDEETELVFTIDDKGERLERVDENRQKTSISDNVPEKFDTSTTVLKLVPSSVNSNLKKESLVSPISPLGDFGQSSPEDKDLYTTRS